MAESQSIITNCFRNRHADTGDETGTINGAPSSMHGFIDSPTTRDLTAGASSESAFQHSFEMDLNTTRVYTRTRLYKSDESFTTSVVRSHVWSILSGLSLSEVSNISVIALPLYPNELLGYYWCELENRRRSFMNGTKHHLHPSHGGSGQSTTINPGITAQAKREYRDIVIREWVETEQRYVQNLAQLHELKDLLEHREVISTSDIQEIFMNLDAILEFCRNFLGRLENAALLHAIDVQEWSCLFVTYEDGFNVYITYIGKLRQAILAARRHVGKISQISHARFSRSGKLDDFIRMPQRRLVAYPLLLKVKLLLTIYMTY